MTRFIFLSFLFTITNILVLPAQETAKPIIDSVYLQKKIEKSVSFAALTLGGEVLALSGGKINNAKGQQHFGVGIVPRFTIGGQHFWGHADFYVSFPLLLQYNQKPSESKSFENHEAVETGLKIYPYAMRQGRLTPYVGISFQPMIFGYAPQGTDYQYGKTKFIQFVNPVQAGITYSSSKFLITAGVRYNWKNNFEFYESKDNLSKVSVSPLNFNLSILRYMDTDRNMAKPKVVEQLNIRHYLLQKHNKLNAWYRAIGPSTALQMSKSPYFKKYHPYLHDNMMNSFILPDIALGRYFYKNDFNVGISTRAMAFRKSAFDTDIKMKRATFALEAYKFLGDYHGFVPFVGPMLSVEHMRFNENGQLAASTKPALGIVLGWDIRVTHTGTGLLRTNLRYTPNLHMNLKGEKVMFDHLEFNFIQFVKFFGRGKVYEQYREKKK